MQTFSTDIGAVLIAEGVETVDELALLAGTGLPILAQGYAIARPGAPWPAVSLAARRLRTPHPAEAPRRRLAPRTAASPGRS
jgi:EAL domain-containing protein (putative c-di-GMP-specific phosphodiesterase class I)